MRVSADRDDPGYRPDLIGADMWVECDGVVVEMVITADEQAGTVLAYSPDANGNPYTAPDRRGPVTYELRGTVVVHMPPERWIAAA